MGLVVRNPFFGVFGHAQTSPLTYRDWLESLNFAMGKLIYCPFQQVNNKDADQTETAQMCRLVCTFVVCMQQSQIFS